MQVEHSPLHQLLTKIIATKQASHYDVGATSPHIMSFQSQGLCSVSGFCVWNISLVPPFYISPLHPWNITLALVQTFVGISYQHLKAVIQISFQFLTQDKKYIQLYKRSPDMMCPFELCQHQYYLGVAWLEKATHGESAAQWAGEQLLQIILQLFIWFLSAHMIVCLSVYLRRYPTGFIR